MRSKAGILGTGLAVIAAALGGAWLVVARPGPDTAPVAAPPAAVVQAQAAPSQSPGPGTPAQWLEPVVSPTQPAVAAPAAPVGDRPPQQSFPRYPRHSGR